VIPDLPSLLTIADRLWEGRASLLVGAGMSRNADPLTPDAPPFANWRGLGKAMKDELYSGAEDLGATKDTLRLAEEYEAAFGRSKLVQLVADHVPDRLYRPSDLHVRLLNLPWTDVFTTNYDTLLERAGQESNRYYGVVQRPEDLPQRSEPRIVKLHGGLPSQLPLIITEEDYRTYPDRFAPFVHLVQTSLMEHAFVLIGFSGEDPNFLSWRGWLQDQLGDHAPPIYLCGVLDLSSSKRRLLEDQGVRPVDLGPLFPEDEWPTSERHPAALRWLMETAEAKRPPDPLDWPDEDPRQPSSAPKELPPLPDEISRQPASTIPDSAQGPASLAESIEESMEGPSEEKLKEKISTWREERREYPGWVVAPKKIRHRVWSNTKGRIREFWSGRTNVDELASPFDLTYLYELVWRQDLALVPFFGEQPRIVSEILERYDPAPRANLSELGVDLNSVSGAGDRFSRSYLKKAWVKTGISLLECLRPGFNVEPFRTWHDRLSSAISEKPSWHSRLLYEEALFELSRLNLERLMSILQGWPDQFKEDFPYGETYRARILSEVGHSDKAEHVLDEALERIKDAQASTDEPNIPLLSQEGWVRRLKSAIEGAQDFFPRIRQEEWARKLKEHNCDPSEIMNTIKTDVEGADPTYRPDRAEKEGFDPGDQSTSYNLGPNLKFDDHWPGYEQLRAAEEGGQPFRVRNLAIDAQAVLRAADLIRPFSPGRALTAVLGSAFESNRSSGKKDSLEFFGRPRIAGFSEDDTRKICERLSQGVESGISLMSKERGAVRSHRSGVTRAVAAWLNILSRFSLRLGDEQTKKVIELCVRYAEMSQVKTDRSVHRSLEKSISRALQNAFSMVTQQVAPLILGMSMPEDEHVDNHANDWPEVGSKLRNLEDEDLSVPSALKSKLLKGASSENSSQRCHALLRLHYIYVNGGMEEAEVESFADALWSQTDSSGLPLLSFVSPSFILSCPEPEKGLAKEKLREYLLETPIPQNVHTDEEGRVTGATSSTYGTQHVLSIKFAAPPEQRRNYEHPTDGSGSVEESSRYIGWTQEEAEQLLEKVIGWWNSQKAGFDQDDSSIGEQPGFERDMAKYPVSRSIPVVRDVLLPKLEPETDAAERAEGMLEEMDGLGMRVESMLPQMVRLGVLQESEVLRRLRKGLASSDRKTVGAAARGTLEWSMIGGLDVPDDLISYLVYMVGTRRNLVEAIDPLVDLMNQAPGEFSEDHIQRLLDALSYLLESTGPPSREEVWTSGSLIDKYEDMPSRRSAASSLAKSLKQLIQDFPPDYQGIEVLDEWREKSLDSPLPEVRRHWI